MVLYINSKVEFNTFLRIYGSGCIFSDCLIIWWGYEQFKRHNVQAAIYRNLISCVKPDYIRFSKLEQKVINNFYRLDINRYNHSNFLNH